MPGQAVLPLDSQPDQYATTFRREVDAADLLVVFAVIHIEDLGNPKALNPDPQSRADGVGARGGRPGRADDLAGPHIDHGSQPGPDRCIARYSGEQGVAHPDVMLAVIGDPDLVGHQRFEVGQQVGLTTLLKLSLAFPAQDQQGLGQLLQIRPDGAVARWSGALWLEIPQIAQQGLVHQPNRQSLTQVLVLQICADSGMGLEKPRLSLIRANSVDQTRIAQLAVLCIPVPERSDAEVVLIGEVAGQRVHASHDNTTGGTKRRTGSLAAAAEFQQRRNHFQALQGLGVLSRGKVEALGFGNLRQRSKQVGLVWIRAKRQSGAVWSRQQRLLEEFQLRFNRQRRQWVFALASPVAPYTFRGPVPRLTLSRQPAHMLRVPAGQGSHFTGSDPMLFHHLFGPLLLEIALQNFVSWIALSW